MLRAHVRLRRSLLIGVLVFALVAAPFVAAWFASPGVADLEARLAARERATRVQPVPLARVSLFLREAIVATEDERFYQNHGVDLLGIARAIPYDLGHLSFAQGASTITDQLVKLLYLGGNDHAPWRKLVDLVLSLRVSTRYTKEQVLDAYLNSAYFGNGAYGVGEASRRYFGRTPSHLSVAQASLLAGLVQAPTAYDPLVHPHAARLRQLDVLRSLVRDGYLTSGVATGVLETPLPLVGGRVVPPLTGPIVTSQPAVALAPLAYGGSLIVVCLVVLVALRRRASDPRGVVRLLRWVCVLALLAGVITASNSITAL